MSAEEDESDWFELALALKYPEAKKSKGLAALRRLFERWLEESEDPDRLLGGSYHPGDDV